MRTLFTFTFLLFVVVAGTSCGQPTPVPDTTVSATAVLPVAARDPLPSPEPDQNPPAQGSPQSPIQTRLTGPETVPTQGDIELVLTIDRARADLVPISVDLRLPAGVTLVAGLEQERVADTSKPGFTRTWRLHYDRVPQEDVAVVVDWQTASAGFHAELPWRFGRPEARKAEPPRLPGAVKLPGGRSLGRPILTGGGAAK
jgi:hypothetical protein